MIPNNNISTICANPATPALPRVGLLPHAHAASLQPRCAAMAACCEHHRTLLIWQLGGGLVMTT